MGQRPGASDHCQGKAHHPGRRCFFFSSRRRHTRLQGDWSSDVCSSDLGNIQGEFSKLSVTWPRLESMTSNVMTEVSPVPTAQTESPEARLLVADDDPNIEIGRASCRERV